MKISYIQLQTYFAQPLPSPNELAEKITFHAWEIESVEKLGEDTVLDVKVLPDKSAWALSHRGIAKDISNILSIPLAYDPLTEPALLEPKTDTLNVEVQTEACTRYTAALITGVKVGPSPKWLVDFLTAMGQRSINNVVDISNYVMFGFGQPLHAFDARKLYRKNDGGYNIIVRNAYVDEKITTLTGEVYSLSVDDALIVDGGTDTPIGIAGIKGGKHAEVDINTVDIILESANFKAVATRKTSQRLKLRTEASTRYENSIASGMASYGLVEAVESIIKECGGSLEGYVDSNPTPVKRAPVTVTRAKINAILGMTLSRDEVRMHLSNLSLTMGQDADVYVVTPPFERPDIIFPEDVVEEIGRMYGYEHIPSIAIEKIPLREINNRFFYSEKIRDVLFSFGFSEVFTSSFRDVEEVCLSNALASDKGCLRSVLYKNLNEALQKNAGNVELSGSDKVRIFEIGTVFTNDGEKVKLALGVSSKSGVTTKDFKEVQTALTALAQALGISSIEQSIHQKEGVIEIDLGTLIDVLPTPTAYEVYEKSPEVTYRPFSNYPYVVRDIAFWTPQTTTETEALGVVKKNAGPLAVRVDCFDRFEKDGRVSYGFRIVFQSHQKTLTAEEVDAVMHTISSAISDCGWKVR